MRNIAFYLLLLSAIVPIIEVYQKPDKIYQLPFLYGMALIVYILPTLFGVKDSKIILSDSEYIRYTLFSLVCFWAAVLGYKLYNFKKIGDQKKIDSYNEKKMSIVLYLFMTVSFVAVLKAGTYDPQSRNGGSYAIVLYFARLLRPTTIILFILWLLKPSKDKLFFLIISLLCSLKIILIDGRRSEVFSLFITIAFPLFFINNKIAPRIFIIPAIFLSLVIFTFLPAARQYTLKGDFSSVVNISPAELIESQIKAENTNEVVDAAKNMEVAELSSKYNWGSTVYNGFVIQFASATIFGNDFKNSLLLPDRLNLEDLRDRHAKYDGDEYRFYLAPTGFSAVFFEFGYGGIILFFLFGIISKIFYEKAGERNSIFQIIFYCFFATFILFSIYDSILSIPSMIILYLIVFYTSKRFSKISTS